MVRRHSQDWGRSLPHGIVLVAGLLLALAVSPPARAVTAVSVDGHPNPVTLTVGETITIRFDVAKAGGSVGFNWTRDVAGTGKFDPNSPVFVTTNTVTDGGAGDTDPAPGKIAWSFAIVPGMPAGRYLPSLVDRTDNSTFAPPMDWTVVPRSQAQAVSGHVLLGSGSTAPGSPPPDAIIWAYSDLNTPVASADAGADGSYVLPLPPGTYILFSEWFGSLSSQRQVVTVASGQATGPIDHRLLVGLEVSGALRDDAGKPMSNSWVTATPTTGEAITTQSFVDGTYVLVLPEGQYRVSARGMEKRLRVADQPLDGIDFPPPPPGPAPTAGTIVTVAGNGRTGLAGDGGLAAASRLQSPVGLATDQTGNLYIVDNVVNRVRKVDGATGIITTIAGSTTLDTIRGLAPFQSGSFSGDGGPATAAQLNTPQHLALDAAGNLYIADVNNHRVRRVEAKTGVITTVAGSGAIGTGKGSFSGDGGLATTATLNGPQALVLDPAGYLYIADNLNGRVRRVSPEGIITTVAGGGKNPVTDGADATSVTLGRPRNLAHDGQGNLFIWDGSLNRVLKMSADGKLSFYAGNGTAGFSGDDGPATAAQLNADFLWIAADSAGDLFLADALNNRVRKVSPAGIITTVAGGGPTGLANASFSGDGGPATAATLSVPRGLVVDAAGNLYIASFIDKRVRKVIGIAAPGLLAGQ